MASTNDWIGTGPIDLLRRLSSEMEYMLGGFGGGQPASGPRTSTWLPALEVFERDSHLVVRAELPGMRKEDVRVDLEGDSIVIEGERRREHEGKEAELYRSERSYGQFYRRITLPEECDAERAKAKFQDGILEITVPMSEKRNQRRQIQVES